MALRLQLTCSNLPRAGSFSRGDPCAQIPTEIMLLGQVRALVQSLSLLVESPGPQGTSWHHLSPSWQSFSRWPGCAHTHVSPGQLPPRVCAVSVTWNNPRSSWTQPGVMQCPASHSGARGNALCVTLQVSLAGGEGEEEEAPEPLCGELHTTSCWISERWD